MSELIKELIKIVNDGDLAIDNLIEVDGETDSIFKRFPFLSISEKKVAIERYKYLKEVRPSWLEQVTLVKEFLLNTVNDLSTLEDGWFEKMAEARKLKKLYKMIEKEFETETNKEKEKEKEVEKEVETPIQVMTPEAQEILKKEIQDIQTQKKEINKNTK